MLYFLFFLVLSIIFLVKRSYSEVVCLLLLFTMTISVFMMKMISVGMVYNISNQFFPLFLDWFGILLVLLSLLVVVFSIIAGFSHVFKSALNIYFNLMVIIMLFLTLFFSVWNILLFFFMFEFVLLPMIFIIVLWGSQMERLMANYYFFLYTIIGGFPLLLSLIYLSMYSRAFYMSMVLGFGFDIGFIYMMGISLAFLCKLPIYSLHIWLPKAHVEAPVGSSMVLAGLLLKMSGYGVLRTCGLVFFIWGFGFYLFISLLLVSMLYPLVICYRQSDVKSLIAYSSVSHMCVGVLGLLFFGIYGLKSAFIVFLSHGLISPSMFYIGNLIYERLGSRMILSMGGFEGKMKSFLFFLLLFFIGNMGYPPLISFFGELCVYFSLLSYNFYFWLVLFLFVLVSSVVMFYYIAKLMKSSEGFKPMYYLNSRERFGLFSMMFFLMYMTPLMVFL